MLLLYVINKNEIIIFKRIKIHNITTIFTIIVILSEIATNIFDNKNPDFRVFNIIFNIIGFSISLYIPLFLSALYTVEYKSNGLLYLSPIFIINFLFITTPFTGWMFDISSENIYNRGPYFFIYILGYLYGFILFIITNLKMSKKFIRGDKTVLLLMSFLIIGGTGVQVAFPDVHTSWHCVTISLIIYYVFQRELYFRYDPITGMLTRIVYENHLKKAHQYKNGVVIIFDINKFKQINDFYGHQKGDLYLKLSAQAVKKAFDEIGNCYRIGGDEFCVIAKIDDEKQLNKYFDKFNNYQQRIKNDFSVFFGISYGYSVFSKNGNVDIHKCIKQADKMMYKNKLNNLKND
ncbi:MAG: GGDEF domain-containing protein [Oscillospiraceae bacterium]